jgi:hypothetical protein
MVIPGNARPIGRTVRIGYVSAIFVFLCLVLTIGYTPAASALSLGSSDSSDSSAPLGKTLGGLTDKTVPAVTKAVTDTTAPITDAVSPSLTKTVSDVTTPVATTVAPAVTSTVEAVAKPVVTVATDVAGPIVPATVNTLDSVAAPVTNDVAPAVAQTADAVLTPVTTVVGEAILPAPQNTNPVPSPAVSTPNQTPLEQRFSSRPSGVDTVPTLNSLPFALSTAPIVNGDPSQPAAYTGLANLFNQLAQFISGAMRPVSWVLGTIDSRQAVALWLEIFAAIIMTIVTLSSGGLYSGLRKAQKDVFMLGDELMFNTTLSSKVMKLSAASVIAILILSILVLSFVLTGT